MFELSVLPADIDGQTLPIKLHWFFFTVFSHLLCILSSLHLNETLKTDGQTDNQSVGKPVSQSARQVVYLSLQPVGKILSDSSKWLGQFQDVCVRKFAGRQLSDVDHLTGATLDQ